MTLIGILSDTHVNSPSSWFIEQAERAFRNCSVILHAGDLTEVSILGIFKHKVVHAVHGNMCEASSCHNLPVKSHITIDGFRIGLCHGAGARHNIEERMWELFPDVDCIVYGHTHIAVIHRLGKTLFINPGSFSTTGRYGAQGSYAILETSTEGLNASLFQLPGVVP